MDWSWGVFSAALPLAIIFSMFSRGAMNSQNVARFGPEADYRAAPGKAIFGSIVGGSIWAAIITLVIGFF